jgi:hypothetical protein
VVILPRKPRSGSAKRKSITKKKFMIERIPSQFFSRLTEAPIEIQIN